MIGLVTGDIPASYRYLLDLIQYSQGEVKEEARELSDQLRIRLNEGITEIPDELIRKAELIVHRVRLGFKSRAV